MVHEARCPLPGKRLPAVSFAVGLFLTMACAEAPAERTAPPQAPAAPARVVYAGVRSSQYGAKPFPRPAGWEKAIGAMASDFPGSTPCAIWIVGTMARTPRFAHLEFPADGKTYPGIEFEPDDRHEPYLTRFDKAGIKVFLQVEPANADVATLIDLVLGRYKHHPCVVGFGIDVEWNRTSDYPETGMAVDDATARAWEERVKSHSPAYRLFLKHWDEKWMPPTYRGDIVFVDDSQIFPDLEAMVKEFAEKWAPAFAPNLVVFQVGYNSDKAWWSKLPDPPKTIGEAILAGVRRDIGLIWVDFSLKDVLPTDGQGPGERP
ncbi:MAG TPA: hypothetical protein VEG35_02170 [Burkholderiales bacterium]|nr:hypothetical protein [Burkholderiales bacterium]